MIKNQTSGLSLRKVGKLDLRIDEIISALTKFVNVRCELSSLLVALRPINFLPFSGSAPLLVLSCGIGELQRGIVRMCEQRVLVEARMRSAWYRTKKMFFNVSLKLLEVINVVLVCGVIE